MTKTTAQKVVTRFAPSPTGFLHVGTARTALYAWAFARKHGGTFILRIEDTDKEREVPGSIEHIIESLKWLGVEWDEGIDIGGPHAPYIQSKRLESYQKYAKILIDKGLAYADPYTKEEIDAFRKIAEIEKRPFLYRDHRPTNPPVWDGSMPLRFKNENIHSSKWHDLVRGDLTAGPEAHDDLILIKSDGYPTYNFAHIIDDLEMGVTHILRADEFISSVPNYLALYEALDIARPEMAMLPPIMGPDGKKKLSKRDGAKDLLQYKKEGYLPEAVMNFLALIGWNPGNDIEILTPPEFIEAFNLEHIQKAGGKLNEEKLVWLNKEYMKKLSDDVFLEYVQEYMPLDIQSIDGYSSTLHKILPLLRERLSTFGELTKMHESGDLDVFFKNPSHDTYDTVLLLCPEKMRHDIHVDEKTTAEVLKHVRDLIDSDALDELTAEKAKELIWPYAESKGKGIVLWPLRVALSGKEKSPDPFQLIEIFGKEKTLKRIDIAIEKLIK